MNVLEEIAKLAIECLTLDIEERPKINDVAQRLRTLQTHREGQKVQLGNLLPHEC